MTDTDRPTNRLTDGHDGSYTLGLVGCSAAADLYHAIVQGVAGGSEADLPADMDGLNQIELLTQPEGYLNANVTKIDSRTSSPPLQHCLPISPIYSLLPTQTTLLPLLWMPGGLFWHICSLIPS